MLDNTIISTARSLGVPTPPGGAAPNNAPRTALLAGYRAAQWVNFAFVMLGLAVALVFLRDIGVIAEKCSELEDVDASVEGVYSKERKRDLEDED